MSTTPPNGRGDGVRGARAIVLLVVTVVVAVLLLRHVGTTSTTSAATAGTGSHHPVAGPATTTTTVPSATTTTVAPIPPAQVRLLVLNGTGAGELATETGSALKRAHGYDVLAPDNTTATVTTSAIYAVGPTYVGAADALAAAVGLPATVVQDAVPATAPVRPVERTLANVVLVIGPGFTVPSAAAPAATTPSATSSASAPAAG